MAAKKPRTQVNVDFDITGYNELNNRVTELGRRGSSIQNSALKKAAEPIFEQMVAIAPVRTGRGRASIKIGRVSSRQEMKSISIGIHSDDHDTGLHMYYQEFGTSRHPAQPFIRPAFDTKKQEAFALLKAELKRGLGL